MCAHPRARLGGLARRAHRHRWHLIIAVGALAVLGLAPTLGVGTSAHAQSAAVGEFVPLPAANLVDSVSGIGWSGQLQPGATRSVPAAGVAGMPATGVLAVMVHITTTSTTNSGSDANGSVWAWPAGADRPAHAIIANAPAGSSADNTAIVRVGASGGISFYNDPDGTPVDIAADVEGYVTSAAATQVGATFAALTPTRIIDTADGTGGRSTPLTASAPRRFHILGVGGIPDAGVSAVALNIGTQATGRHCWVQVQPSRTPPPGAGFPRVDTYADYTAQQFALVAPGANGDITFSTDCASTDVSVDVQGYYLAAGGGSSGEVYVPMINPARVVDTRANLGIAGPLTAGRVVRGSGAVAVSGVGGVPADADAVVLSVSATDATAPGQDTIWTNATPQPTSTSTLAVDPGVANSGFAVVRTGPTGSIDVASTSSDPSGSSDLRVEVQGYFHQLVPAASPTFATPHYYPAIVGDTFYNTVASDGDILATANDTHGANNRCGTRGSDIAILKFSGASLNGLTGRTVNCMTSYGPRGGGQHTIDGCSWKTGGITRIGHVVYLAIARQLHGCSVGLQTNGLQPSFDASIIKSVDGGRTWTNPWGETNRTGAAPAYSTKFHRYRAMFPGQNFSVPFFIQYGPGNTHTVDGANKYLYAVSTDGYAYNGNSLRLARVPLNKVQNASAWQFYHGRAGGDGRRWTHSPAGATRVLQAAHSLSQPAIQYVPALKRYVLLTFSFTRAHPDFPTPAETPYTRFSFFSAPKPWGPWTQTFEQPTQRTLWCTASPCWLEHWSKYVTAGAPDDWLGFYDPALVQKLVFTRPLDRQALFTCGDWKNSERYAGESLYRLYAMPFDLNRVLQ